MIALALAAALLASDLAAVNLNVNRSIREVSDQSQYGVHDKWVVNPASRQGDCEDYALTKMLRLLEMGVSPSDVRLLTVQWGAETHMVLQVGDVVLDNQFPTLQRADRYAPLIIWRPQVAFAKAGRSDLAVKYADNPKPEERY